MTANVVSREAEERAVADFLTSASTNPAGLLIEGEPGIGKTTMWLTAVDQARERGFEVLSARAAAAESVLAYATLADLLGRRCRTFGRGTREQRRQIGPAVDARCRRPHPRHGAGGASAKSTKRASPPTGR